MKTRVRQLAAVAIGALVIVGVLPAAAVAQSVRDRYVALQEREQEVLALIEETSADATAATREAVIRQARRIVAAYDALVRRYHSSGYADNALWNAAVISDALFNLFGRQQDQVAATRYRERLIAEYPSSSLVKLAKAAPAAKPTPASAEVMPADAVEAFPSIEPLLKSAATLPAVAKATLKSITREVLPEGVRITLSLDREVAYREERLSGPERVFFDLKDVQVSPHLRDGVLRYSEDAVRQIRVGRHPQSTVRVVLDLEGVKNYSVFTLYNPFRVVVDCDPLLPTSAASRVASASRPPAAAPPRPMAKTIAMPPAAPPTILYEAEPVLPSAVAAAAVTPVAAPSPPPAPEPPRSNAAGGFSLSRQLGLGVSRVVIDPGHGGHDPGAQGKGLNEADLTLDVALRLEKLLLDEGLEVILTRRTNVYVGLEQRTAIANHESADLFLSIHANASRNEAANGVETYYLSFASSPGAEAVAARENSASAGGMHNLPDIIKAIALNNKLDESRDFAGMVQEALVSRLRRSNKNVRNLGVKKAPFVVLIGAGMPSVLAEISFLTNKQDLQLLKTTAYKQRVAEALHASIMRYRRSLKGQGQVAEQ